MARYFRSFDTFWKWTTDLIDERIYAGNLKMFLPRKSPKKTHQAYTGSQMRIFLDRIENELVRVSNVFKVWSVLTDYKLLPQETYASLIDSFKLVYSRLKTLYGVANKELDGLVDLIA